MLLSRIAWLLPSMFVSAVVAAQSPTELGKNHASVRAAFSPAIVAANKSIARVFWGDRSEDVALATIVAPDGYLLTKASELQGEVECQLPGGRRLPAQIVARDRGHDLALLKVAAIGLEPIQWSETQALEPGTLVAVAGRGEAPLSLGVVGGVARRVPPTQGVLGIVVRQSEAGPRITQVMPGSRAETSGLIAGDVVTHVGQRRVQLCRELVGFVKQFEPGQSLQLTIERDGREQVITTGLDESNVAQEKSGLQRDIPSAVRVPLSNRRGGFAQVFPHDAFLRPNDCGGPLVDLEGKAVGINIARADRATSYAIPANLVRLVISRLRAQE
ncbi:MAG: trypsin-like peptidase domain-containing protein [Planctomycetales bacterium]|nr:trypsin-like peptidase domain-containing protein [Planctomycetales bacterium]